MKTRLTNAMRDEIIERVMKATNLYAEREQIKTETKERAREAFLAAQPAGFNALAAQYPKEWFKAGGDIKLNDADNNPCVYLDSVDGKGAYRNRYVRFDPPSPTAVDQVSGGDEVFYDLVERAKAWAARHDTLLNELRAFLLSCSTVEAMLERMPELAPHIPKASGRCFPLVAPSNLLSQLQQSGFAA